MANNINLKCNEAPCLINLTREKYAAAAVGETREEKIYNFLLSLTGNGNDVMKLTEKLINNGIIAINGLEYHNISLKGNVMKVVTYDLWAPWDPLQMEVNLDES